MMALLYPEVVLQFLYPFQDVINKNTCFYCNDYATGSCLFFSPLWWPADLDTIHRRMKEPGDIVKWRYEKMECVEHLLVRKKNGSFPPLKNQALEEVDIDQSDFGIWALKWNFMEIFRALKWYLKFQNFLWWQWVLAD